MSFLLDTCVVSELVREEPDERVVQWLEDQDEQSLHLSVITFGELEKGVAHLPASRKREKLKAWVEQDLWARFSDRTVPFDLPVAVRWGQLLAESEGYGRPLPVVDSMLAATALVHDLTLVSRNVADFDAGRVRVFSPWRAD